MFFTWIRLYNLLGISSALDSIPFNVFLLLKDTFSLVFLFLTFFIFIFISPDYLGHPDNYQLANFLVTPAHIVPEWYFLPLYAVLRSVTSKLFGIFLLLLMILVLLFLPFFVGVTLIRVSFFRPFFSFFFWFFIVVCVILCWLGSLPVILPYTTIGVLFSFFYFFVLVFAWPMLTLYDRFLYASFVLSKKSL